MAIESRMLPIGTRAPDFALLDTVTGTTRSLQELKSGFASVIMFICNHCPYVKHVQEGIVQLARDYLPKGVSFIAISANDAEQYPDDSPEKMKELAEQFHFPFPYLYDETQETAKAYDAACTPDFFIFDGDLKCVYRGQMDSSRPKNDLPVTGRDIRDALDALLQGRSVNLKQTPSIGCSIKWKVDIETGYGEQLDTGGKKSRHESS